MRITLLSTCLALLLSASAALASDFTLSSPDMTEGGMLSAAQVYKGFGCDGNNRSPALNWTTPPAGTRSLALTVYDPDAPTGSGWWHWVVFNIPATERALPAGAGAADGKALPAGVVQSRTDFGTPGFGGACPPSGDAAHRYIFTLHALDTERLDLPQDASAAMVGFMLGQHTIAKATLTARYGR